MIFPQTMVPKSNPRISCASFAFTASIAAAYAAYKIFSSYKKEKCLRALIVGKQAFRQDNVNLIERLLQERSSTFDPNIVELEFEDLRDRLQNDHLTPTEVLLAFQKQALKAHQMTNCLVEFLIEATEWAHDLTQKYHKTGAEKPYLYGIPISVKETFKVKGHDSTIGMAQLINKPADEDSWLVGGLKRLGAVPFVLTNVPQTMLSIGSSNPVFGTTCGPFDPNRSPGGSSSGEAALMALSGSPLGLGTDIGGSVRLPAHFCGIYALKPTIARISQQGRVGMASAIVIKPTVGLMAPSLAALIHCYRALWAKANDIDPCVAPMPLNDDLLKSKNPLVIGYYKTDDLVEPLPACRRAVEKACEILRSKGHKLVPFRPLDTTTFINLYKALILPDDGRFVRGLLSRDIIEPSQANTFDGNRLRVIYRYNHSVFQKSAPRSIDHFQTLYKMLVDYKYKFAEHYKSAELDCLICPVSAVVAPGLLEPPKMFLWGWNYCALFNMLDYPAGVVPCVLADERDEMEAGVTGSNFTEALVRRAGRGASGLPAGVQIVAAPYREEICLRIMSELHQNAEKVRHELKQRWSTLSSSQ